MGNKSQIETKVQYHFLSHYTKCGDLLLDYEKSTLEQGRYE